MGSSGKVDVIADMVANVVAIVATTGSAVQAGETLIVVESMKMEIPVTAPVSGTVSDVCVDVGDVVFEGDVLVQIQPAEAA